MDGEIGSINTDVIQFQMTLIIIGTNNPTQLSEKVCVCVCVCVYVESKRGRERESKSINQQKEYKSC